MSSFSEVTNLLADDPLVDWHIDKEPDLHDRFTRSDISDIDPDLRDPLCSIPKAIAMCPTWNR